ncbi:MAG: cyclase family protein [Alicyclobacillus sp.]|nr:cyclase family protein [Alicyclobacillus sp.]
MTTWYDVSQPIFEGMPVYKNRPEKRPSFQTTSDHARASVHETRICLDVHTGTHIDAPLHMVAGGATIDTIGIERLIRPCRVLDLTAVADRIGRADLEPWDPRAGDFLLFKTRNSRDEAFNPEFVYLSAEGAAFLAERDVAGVGIDALGIERNQPDHATHKILFEAGAVILEGLRLADVPAGRYRMIAAPLRLMGLDAAPARVILTTLEEDESGRG